MVGECNSGIFSELPKRNKPWWNRKIEKLRKTSRRLFNRAQRTKSPDDWSNYRLTLKEYKKEIQISKRQSWFNFCSEVEGVRETARFHKLLSKDGSTKPGSLLIAPDQFTSTHTETTLFLLSTHFPGSSVVPYENHNDIQAADFDITSWDFACDEP